MKYGWYYFSILVISALVLFCFSQYSIFFSERIFNSNPNFQKIAKKIENKLSTSKHYSLLLQDKTKNKKINEIYKFYNDSITSESSNDQTSYYVFKSNKLIFWSKNLDVSEIKDDSAGYIISNIQNAWYVGQWSRSDNVKVLSLLLLKYDYPYQNKFLKNSYNPEFNELTGYNITNQKEKASHYIVLPDGSTVYLTKEIKRNENSIAFVKSILQWASFLLMFVAIIVLYYKSIYKRKPLVNLLLFCAALIALRGIGLFLNFPSRSGNILFSPEIYAHSSLNPSLGDYLINALFFFTIALFIYKTLIRITSKFSFKSKYLWAFVTATLMWSLFIIVDGLFASLVMHSTVTFETYRIFNISIFSILGYTAISFWIASFLLFVDLWIKAFQSHLDLFKVSLTCISGFLIALVLAYIADAIPSYYGIAWAILTFSFILWFRFRGIRMTISWFLVLIGILALYSVALVSDYSFRKDQDVRKVLAINLSNERDPVAEMLFGNLEKRLQSDTLIHHYLEDVQKHDIEMFGYLQKVYFNGYFKKYDFRATVCFPGSDLIMDNTDHKVDCNGFFNDMISVYGIGIPGTSFYFLNLQNGRISYVGYAECNHKSMISRLYIELDSKLNREQLGYPELLIEGNLLTKSKLSAYTTAKYHQNQLIAQTGEYPYRLANPFKVDSTQKFVFTNQGRYNHLVYRNDSDDIVVLSRPRESILNTTASFAYIFFFFGLLLTAMLNLAKFPLGSKAYAGSFKNRIKTAMILVVFISLILVASVSIAYSIKSFGNRNVDNLSEKLLSVMVDIERDSGKDDLFASSNSDYLANKLVQLSNVFYTDINIYDTLGFLVGSSRPEIFERKLQGKTMNPSAWYEMNYLNNQKLIHHEEIGNMTFLSAYVPLSNQNGKVIGYLNLPYFTRQAEFVAELYSIIVAIINIYALITLFAIAIAVIISTQISKPLELIREKIRKVDISGHNEPIKYNKDDELGQLVKEYNRMVLELADSADKLARSQRESAWREMAKQIAHEIKNPLTPMKLSIQHLVKAKREGVDDWDSMFQKFSSSLIEQINTLSNIATEFSNFAKMPVSSMVEVDINSVIDEVLTLFSGYNNTRFSYFNSYKEPIIVKGDREQLFRVFVNLSKNSVQSIDKLRKGEVTITISCSEKTVIVTIADNGRGIPEELQGRIFSPNFTTKSGGMGLGLAIVKGIVENTGGRIWFETEINTGTKFFVELPLLKNSL